MTQTPAPTFQESDPLAMLSIHRDTRFSYTDQESALRRFIAVIDEMLPLNWKASRGLSGWAVKMGEDLQGTLAYSLFNRPWLFYDDSWPPVITLHPNVRYPNLEGLEGLIGYLASQPEAPVVYVIPEGSWERTGRTVLVILPAGFDTIGGDFQAAGWERIPTAWQRQLADTNAVPDSAS